jgi:hypothetical protein
VSARVSADAARRVLATACAALAAQHPLLAAIDGRSGLQTIAAATAVAMDAAGPWADRDHPVLAQLAFAADRAALRARARDPQVSHGDYAGCVVDLVAVLAATRPAAERAVWGDLARTLTT